MPQARLPWSGVVRPLTVVFVLLLSTTLYAQNPETDSFGSTTTLDTLGAQVAGDSLWMVKTYREEDTVSLLRRSLKDGSEDEYIMPAELEPHPGQALLGPVISPISEYLVWVGVTAFSPMANTAPQNPQMRKLLPAASRDGLDTTTWCTVARVDGHTGEWKTYRLPIQMGSIARLDALTTDTVVLSGREDADHDWQILVFDAAKRKVLYQAKALSVHAYGREAGRIAVLTKAGMQFLRTLPAIQLEGSPKPFALFSDTVAKMKPDAGAKAFSWEMSVSSDGRHFLITEGLKMQPMLFGPQQDYISVLYDAALKPISYHMGQPVGYFLGSKALVLPFAGIHVSSVQMLAPHSGSILSKSDSLCLHAGNIYEIDPSGHVQPISK